MDNDTEDVEPSKLRSLLEDQIGQNKAMASELASYKAADVIVSKGLMYVTPEDLADTSLEDIESKADALEQERSKVFGTAIRRSLEAQGVTGDALDQQVSAFLAGQETVGEQPASSETVAAFQRARSMGTGGGVPSRNPETMSTMEKLQAGLSG
jgi:hypothetical protein